MPKYVNNCGAIYNKIFGRIKKLSQTKSTVTTEQNGNPH